MGEVVCSCVLLCVATYSCMLLCVVYVVVFRCVFLLCRCV